MGRRAGDVEEGVFALVREHAYELLRFARRFSLCEEDAQDAYQRALEILVRQLRAGAPPDNTLSWLRTVLRHEASQVREERERRLGREDHDVEEQRGERADDPAEHVERFERLAHAAEALRRLKPQEVTALVLRAQGLSYQEICKRTQWTYTRCNRCISEGRRALRERLRDIESGAECERWLPLLSMLADGEASSREVAELRPHLRSCTACRATLRGFHEAPRQIGALVPLELLPVALAGAGAGGATRQLEAATHWLLERATVSAMRMQAAIDALPGAKIAAVAASTVAVAGSGAAIERAATDGKERDRRPQAVQQVASNASSNRPVVAPALTAPVLPAPQGVPGAASRRSAAPTDGGAGPTSEFSLEPVEVRSTGPGRPRKPAPRRSARGETPPSPTAATATSPPEPSLAQPTAPPPQPPPTQPREFNGFEPIPDTRGRTP